MTTLNSTIYTKAITEINDPFISASYNTNPVDFYKTMYNYLVNAIPMYIVPSTMVAILDDRVESSGETEVFSGDGSNKDFVLTTIPTANAYFSYKVDDSYVTGSFDSVTNTVTLDSAPDSGTENVEIEWYETGYFNQTLTTKQQDILACFIVCCWAEKEKNFLLDIRRLLNDTDFRLSSEANSMRSKGDWFYSMKEKAEKMMNQNNWNSYASTMRTRYGLS
jgi:hypothetical protein